MTSSAALAVGSVGGDVVRTFTLQETTGSAPLPVGSYISGFMAFAPGDIPTGNKAVLCKADGTTAFAVQQYDEVRLHDDGSLRGASYKFVLENAVSAGSSVDFTVIAASGLYSNSNSHEFADVIALGDYKIEAVVGGTTYTAAINDAEADIEQIGEGGVCSDWIVRVKLQNGGTDHASMWARFYFRLHTDGTTLRAQALLLNDYVENAAAISVTTASFKIGSTTICSWSSKTLYPQGSFYFGHEDQDERAYWSANEPRFYVSQDMQEMEDAGLIWALRDDAALVSALGTSPTIPTYAPDDGTYYFAGTPQDSGGGNHWLGMVTTDDAKALVSRNKNWHRRAMIMQMTSFTSPTHFYERDGYFLPVLNDLAGSYSMGTSRESVGAGASATLTITGRPSPTFSTNASHYPCWGFYPYIMTGDRIWLDEVQSHVTSLILDYDPGTSSGVNSYTRKPTINGVTYHGAVIYVIRAYAWYTRMLSNAEWLTPDSDPARQYFDDLLNLTQMPVLAAFAQACVDDNADRANLGWLHFEWAYYTLLPTWMSDYLALSLLMVAHRYPSHLTNGMIQHHVQKMCIARGADGCVYNGAAYFMGQEKNGTRNGSNDLATAWSEVYSGQDGDIDALTLLIPSPGGCPTSGLNANNPYTGGHTYPGIWHAAMTAGAKKSLTDAATVRDKLAAEEPSPADFASAPQWHLAP